MTDWYSVDDAEQTDRLLGAWDDAPIENTELCAMLLDTAREQVVHYAPELAAGAPVPPRWVYAQLKQAENLWNAGRVNGSGDLGVEQYTFTPRPLDKTIRGIIRPTDGKPHVL